MRPVNSPFKFLDSYQQEDADIFFGRATETDALYNALSGVKHLLVYGPSGAGKTSLIECGLRNQFSDADWFAVSIRRGANMTASVFARINEALHDKIDLDPKTKLPSNPDFDFGEAIENLFAERYQPVYLLFDQFEELLILGDEAEKKDFFTRLNRLIRYKVPCRVMLVMREEFIGHLSEFEPLCPSIFQHRFRLEKMGRSNVQSVIQQILEAEKYQSDFRVEQPAALAKNILAKLPDTQREIELAHVQVFLEELWDRATAEAAQPLKGELPMLHSGLVKENDNLERVLDSFLKKQLEQLERSHGEKVPLELLAAMISERHTKLQLGAADLENALAKNGVALQKPLPDLLRDLEQRRIIRTLKSGEQTQYEISHDVLALVVGQNLTPDMIIRKEAERAYLVYTGRLGMLSQDDLDYLRPFVQYLGHEERLNLGQRILESEKLLSAQMQAEKIEIERRRRRALWTAVVAGVLILVAVVASVLALQTLKRAKQAEENAEIAKREQYLANRFAEQKKREAKESENFAEVKTNEANAAEQHAEISKRLAELKTKEAKTAVDLAEIKKLEAEKAVLQANALLDASKLMAAKKLPDNFDALIPLDSLDCSLWNLGSISSEIGKLQNLRNLNLAGNGLKFLPVEIGQLQNLQALILWSNGMRILPTEICNLHNLQLLELWNNKLEVLPAEIIQLDNLKSLGLGGNGLKKMPPEIVNLKNLESLNLASNELKNLPSEIVNLIKLKSLDLSSNNELKIVPIEIFQLKNLQKLNFGSCNLKAVPSEIGQLQNLQSLNFYNNDFKLLPSEILQIHNLQSLELNHCGLKTMPVEIKQLKKLQLLDWGSNDLRILPDEIGHLQNLKSLILDDNDLEILPAEIGLLQNLQELHLFGNELKTLPIEIRQLQKLKLLSLGTNKLKIFPAELLKLQNLKSLVLDHNQLETLPDEITQLKNLTNLNLSNNPLKKVDIEAFRAAMPWCEIQF